MHKKSLLAFSTIAALTVSWLWPNIHGYYRFRQYCAHEGGLKVFGNVLPRQGWLAAGSNPHNYKAPFYLRKVAFVRYQDRSGKQFDVYAKPNPWPKDPSYLFQPVDESKPVMYMLKNRNDHVPGELRLVREQRAVYSVQEKRMIVSHTNFVYEVFNREKTILDMPTGAFCPSLPITNEEFASLILN